MVIIMKNKRGWIEIVEAVIAVLLVATVLLIVINKGYLGKKDISENVYKTELSILREIETNEEFREEIVNVAELPIEWENFPADIKTKIIERTPTYLECIGKICRLCEEEICATGEENLPCNIEERTQEDIYSQSIVINHLLGENVVYRKLNLFCWTK